MRKSVRRIAQGDAHPSRSLGCHSHVRLCQDPSGWRGGNQASHLLAPVAQEGPGLWPGADCLPELPSPCRGERLPCSALGRGSIPWCTELPAAAWVTSCCFRTAALASRTACSGRGSLPGKDGAAWGGVQHPQSTVQAGEISPAQGWGAHRGVRTWAWLRASQRLFSGRIPVGVEGS